MTTASFRSVFLSAYRAFRGLLFTRERELMRSESCRSLRRSDVALTLVMALAWSMMAPAATVRAQSASEPEAGTALAPALTLVVTKTADIDDGVCDADCSLREAITAANGNAGAETITFQIPTSDPGYDAPSGRYTITLSTAGALPNLTSMTIQGLGANVLTVRRDSAAPAQFRIFTVGSEAIVTISGLTISGGHAPDGSTGSNSPFTGGRGGTGDAGGGILNSGTLSVTNSIISANQAGIGGLGGLGLYPSGGTFIGGQGGNGGMGGGIANSGTLTLTNSTISGNQSGSGGLGSNGDVGGGAGGTSGGGGGISNSGTLTVTNSTIGGNQTGSGGSPGGGGNAVGHGGDSGGGGGISNSGTLTVTNSTVSGNQSGSGHSGTSGFGGVGGEGGGVSNAGTLTLTNSTVSGNQTGNGGSAYTTGALPGPGGAGGGVSNSSVLTVTNSTISSNQTGNGGSGNGLGSPGGSGGVGGGLSNSGTLTVTDATVSGNQTGSGGSGYFHVGDGGSGGGIFNSNSTTIGNSIIALNTVAGNGAGPDVSGFFSSQGYNLVGKSNGSTGFTARGDQSGTIASPLDPHLGPLANNNGPTQTHALLSNSTAIDAASFSLPADTFDADSDGDTTEPLPVDQRGFLRVFNGRADIGAYELQPPPIVINNVSVVEGNSGSTNAVFTVTLLVSSVTTVTVDYFTSNGTARSPHDYTAFNGTVAFSPGQTTRTISIPVNGDILFEPDETFFVNLSNPTNAAIQDAQGTGTILNDDAAPPSPLTPSLAIDDVQLTEGNTGSTNATFTVSFSAASSNTVLVDFFTAAGTATAGADYTPVNGTLTFTPGQTAKTITVPVNGDTLFEQDETFFVNLSNPSNATIADAQGTGTILNDDNSPSPPATPSLSINDVQVTEGNAGSTNATFTVSLSAASSNTVLVDFFTAAGTATAGADYTPVNGTLTFTPGQTAKTITVPVNGDTVLEQDETFFVNLSNPSNAAIADAEGTGTILNDDAAPPSPLTPSLAINDVRVTEGNAGSTNATFAVSLSAASSNTVLVDFFTAAGTATAGADYTPVNGTFTFTPGQTAKTITVPVNGDTLFEPDETFFVNLSNPSNATIADAQGTGTILNDDTSPSPPATPSVVINDVQVTEGNAGSTNATFTVSLSAASSNTVLVDFFTAAGTATAGADYTPVNGTLTFTPGQTAKTITVPVNGDTVFEPDETFFVNLSNPTNATIADAQGTGTILNDDTSPSPPATPSVVINDVQVTEGNAGSTNATFTVSLSAASSNTVLVDFFTAAGTATAGADYTPVNGTLTFTPGQTAKTITVPVNGNTLFEPDETFFVNLSNPTNATIADAQGTGTILNDDASPSPPSTPSVVINDVQVTEGNAVSTNATFTVSLSAASSNPVLVDFFTAAGTATAGADYTPVNGTLTFTPGQTAKTITVPVNGDTLFEPDETFFVNLSNPTNATIADAQGTGTILNDDASPSPPSTPSVVINDVQVTEGNAGSTNATFTVSLSEASSNTVLVDFFTAAGTATAGADYTPVNGTLTFTPGQTAKTITVPVNGDTVFEQDETFFVNLSNPTNATIADAQGTGTILNDDAAPPSPLTPSLAINDVQVTEGNAGSTNATFTVSLSAASSNTVLVDFFTAAGTATAGADYTPVNGTLTFTPGQTAKTITVPVNGDTVFEQDETFFVNLSNPTNATIADAQGTGTILNDDASPSPPSTPSVVINDVQVTEGNAGSTNATFTVSLSAASSNTVLVDFFTAAGTATAGADYTPVNGTLTFTPGQTAKTITVPVNGDTLFEPDETFFVNLSNPTNATIADAQGTGTILNDDAQGGIISFSQADYSISESAGLITIMVTRTGDTSAAATVDYATPDDNGSTTVVPCETVNGLAAPRCDFTTAMGTLEFAAGENSKTFTVLISQDNYTEGLETMALTLTNPTGGAVLGVPSVSTLTITDDITEPATNPVDDAANFVRQQYRDFLNREADAAGLAFWKNNIDQCNAPGGAAGFTTVVQCREVMRINTSAAFFLSIEFQSTGNLVRSFYVAALNRPATNNMPDFVEFERDTAAMQQGVVVGRANWQQTLDQNRQAFMRDFVMRAEFVGLYPTTDSPIQYVDKLYLHAGMGPTTTERSDAISEFGSAATASDASARGRVLLRITQDASYRAREINRSFVQMEYFGYLRRNPNAMPDTDFSGYDSWLNKLNAFGGNYITSEMVKAFITSSEYRARFGP
jgi:CSLREA domain-containing protein